MGIASFVIGILCFLGGLIPLMGLLFIAPALIGLIMGIVDWVIKAKKNVRKRLTLAGVILCGFDVVGIIVYYFLFINFVPFV